MNYTEGNVSRNISEMDEEDPNKKVIMMMKSWCTEGDYGWKFCVGI